jgi:hypothetical protein
MTPSLLNRSPPAASPLPYRQSFSLLVAELNHCDTRVLRAHITRWRRRPPMRAGRPQGQGRPRSYILQRPWGSMKRWITIHRYTANPRAILIRSPGLSYTDQMVSLWGLLTRTTTTANAPINSARRTMANTRKPIGMVDAGVPTLGGPSCCGFALTASIWR